MRSYQNFGRQNNRGEYRGNCRDEIHSRGRGGVGLEKGHFQEIMAAKIEGMIETQE